METDMVWVNTQMDIETKKQLETIAQQTGINNSSSTIRWLIRQEYARRYSQPNTLIPVSEAQSLLPQPVQQ